MLVSGLAIGFAAYTTWALRLDKAQEALRLSVLAESALSHMKAGSIEEHVKAGAMKKSYDLNLDMLKDSFAKSKAPAEVQPRFYKSLDGREINSEEYEIV